ncbi:MAG: nucleotide exchange factor GrpE [archaeon]
MTHKEHKKEIKDAIDKAQAESELKAEAVAEPQPELVQSTEEKMLGQIAELTDLLKRTQADFVNYRNRIEKDSKLMGEYYSSDILKKLLPIVDSFDQAIKNEKNENTLKGMKLILGQILDVLKSEGVKEIDCVGKKFDPYKHEVMMKEKSDKEEGIVIEEFLKGYMHKERVLRHSKVKISG